MDGYAYVHHELARYRDGDAFGHVNNAVYLSYLEEARNGWLSELGLVRGIGDITMILARVEIDYRAQIEIGQAIEVGVRCARVGTKSFELEYRLEVVGRAAAEARTVLVAFDYERN